MIASVSNTSLQPTFRAAPAKSDTGSDTSSDASASKTTANSTAANAQSAQKPQTPQGKPVLVESAHTRNTDGTYGPKHTFRPPAGAASVNIKI